MRARPQYAATGFAGDGRWYNITLQQGCTDVYNITDDDGDERSISIGGCHRTGIWEISSMTPAEEALIQAALAFTLPGEYKRYDALVGAAIAVIEERKPKPRYYVRADNCRFRPPWTVYDRTLQHGPADSRAFVACCVTQANAERIADQLNKAGGVK